MTRKGHCIRCGENDPAALVRTTLCRECLADMRGHSLYEDHHIEGQANSHEEISTPRNAHGNLTAKMARWMEMLRRPDPSLILKIARVIQVVLDVMDWFLTNFRWIPEYLVALDITLRERLGDEYWNNLGIAPLQPTKPERSGNEQDME